MTAAIPLPAACPAAPAPAPGPRLSPRARRIALALARAAIPEGRTLRGADETTLDRLESWLDGASEREVHGMEALLLSAELASVRWGGLPISRLSPERAARALLRWQQASSPWARAHLRAVLTPLKGAHFDDPELFARAGCPYPGGDGKIRPQVVEQARWRQRVTDGRALHEDTELECEVVVIGTGAGGAACAYELAKRGRAVLLLEEGDYHDRRSFTGRARPMSRMMYRDKGLTMALGNVGIPIWAGRGVGGSTLINSGTCYRAPDRVLRRWRDELHLPLGPETMAPYYERVESMLGVEPADMRYVGGVGRVVARGAEKLGWHHAPLRRNAPGCDGQGVCCFGCPTGAKRSTDVSYVPAALERGAELVTAAHVVGIDVQGRRARGVVARLGSGRTLKVKAEAVVVAGGALMSPVLLTKTGVLPRTPALGKNLSIHPASKVMALFDETIDMASAIPQGYAVEEFQDEGMMLEGASTPLDLTALAIPWVGPRYVEVLERFRNLATFGFMIEDRSRGAVRPGPGGSPLITYRLGAHDAARMVTGLRRLSELFLAAGARRVMPFLPGAEEITTAADLEKIDAKKIAPADLEITAYHPLGTCRMGTDPRTSVVDPDHETHEVERLYVVDGAAVPTPLGVNPQMTIMAMALRAAERIDARLS
jgi:choline dehydrogenase-like flavoprotein